MLLGIKASISWLATTSQPRIAWTGTATNGYTPGAQPIGLQAVTRVGNIKVAAEKEQADGSSRDSNFFLTGGALLKIPVDFKILWDPSNDPSHIALAMVAFSSGLYIPLLVSDQVVTVHTNNYGVWADWEVLKLEQGDDLNNFETYDVSIQPSALSSVYPQRVSVTG